jgi:hypothetical protein
MLLCCLRRGSVSRYVLYTSSKWLRYGPCANLWFTIQAILSLIFTWDKILEINWKRRREEENLNEPVEGANVTVGELKGINSVVRMFLSVIEIPLYGGAVIAILSIGEANFFSKQVSYQTEPMQAIGMQLQKYLHPATNSK